MTVSELTAEQRSRFDRIVDSTMTEFLDFNAKCTRDEVEETALDYVSDPKSAIHAYVIDGVADWAAMTDEQVVCGGGELI